MLPESAERLEQARSASGDELKSLVHESGEDVLLALLENPHLAEAHVTLLLERLVLAVSILSAFSRGGDWTSSEGLRLRLAAGQGALLKLVS